ncbi:MAG TPA: peptidylprolyl isomerase [Hyphomicrobiaceae bacterium]|nr:peptidylprolyl isomerase [Hyphomicrobiaceae bacterium]
MSCSARSNLPGQRKVVSVNGVVIAHDAISRETQNHPAPTPLAAWTAAARALVVRELLLQEAQRLGLVASPSTDGAGRREAREEALVRQLVEREVATPDPDEAACRRYYESNKARFRAPDIYEASHILIGARRDEPDAFASARERAFALLSHLQAEPARFAELARAHSDCPSAASGGNLGQITERTTTPEFEQALLRLQPGEMTRAPVETRYGFHIIRLDRHIPGQALPFEAVRERIAQYLEERSRRLAVAQYIARLASRAQIGGIDLPTPAALRVY